jgi:hypothetical protein
MGRKNRLKHDRYLACRSPEQLRGIPRLRGSERKHRLLACAIVRHAPFDLADRTIWDLLPTYNWFEDLIEHAAPGVLWNCHRVIETAERFADGLASGEELQRAHGIARVAHWCAEADTFGFNPATHPGSDLRYAAASAVCGAAVEGYEDGVEGITYYRTYVSESPRGLLNASNGEFVCNLIRDVLGDPFRRVVFVPGWRSGDAVDVASEMYEAHDFTGMPVLADALEEAGCTNPDILSHCRGPGPHVRGCWVVDLVLGKG